MGDQVGIEQKKGSPMVSYIAAIILIIFGSINIKSMTGNVPEFVKLQVTEGAIESVETMSISKPYLKICLESDGCYKYPSRSKSWRNAKEILSDGVSVKIWYLRDSNIPWIWQLEYDKKLLLSYKTLKWELESEANIALTLWGVLLVMGVLMVILTTLKIMKKR